MFHKYLANKCWPTSGIPFPLCYHHHADSGFYNFFFKLLLSSPSIFPSFQFMYWSSSYWTLQPDSSETIFHVILIPKGFKWCSTIQSLIYKPKCLQMRWKWGTFSAVKAHRPPHLKYIYIWYINPECCTQPTFRPVFNLNFLFKFVKLPYQLEFW